MATSKTKTKLIDVARQLFAKNGLENTTMNDIAAASGKGRRTLYTYFKSKEEIYFAVIETELERLSDQFLEVVNRPITPTEKLVELIFSHLNIMKEAVCRNGNLRAEFFRNIWAVERVRKNFDKIEIDIFRKVVTEGVNEEDFVVDNIQLMAEIIHYCMKGLEVPYIYGRLGKGVSEEESFMIVNKLVRNLLGKKNDIDTSQLSLSHLSQNKYNNNEDGKQ